MTPPAPEPKPKRSRRMVVWMVAVPIVILLLALAAANWKIFHLAYCKHLIRSSDPKKQTRGIEMVFATHLRKGMKLEEVRAIVAPASVTEVDFLFIGRPPPLRPFRVEVESDSWHFNAVVSFDKKDGRLRRMFFYKPPPDR